MRQNRQLHISQNIWYWVGGFRYGLDIGVNNLKFSYTDWMWSSWKNFGSNPIAKSPYPYTTEAYPELEFSDENSAMFSDFSAV